MVATCYLEFQTSQLFAFWLKYAGSSIPYYAGKFPYYAGIMLYAFQPLLCLKLCWHNRHRPSASGKYTYKTDHKNTASYIATNYANRKA